MIQHEGVEVMTGSFQQPAPANQIELSEDVTDGANLVRRNTITNHFANTTSAQLDNGHEKANSIQLDNYVKKIKEYHLKIEQLEADLRQCKSENESLIDDLCESKTKVAVLEE